MHCGSECFCQMILQLILIGQYLHHGPVIGLRSPVLLAAPSNLPIQVLILPGPLASAAPCAPVELNYFDGITTQMMPLVWTTENNLNCHPYHKHYLQSSSHLSQVDWTNQILCFIGLIFYNMSPRMNLKMFICIIQASIFCPQGPTLWR